MKGILIGAMHKRGSFVPEGEEKAREYNNIVLILQKPIELVSTPERSVQGVGYTTVEAKTPYENFNNVFGEAVKSLKDLEKYIGTEVSYFFNDKGKLDSVLL